MILDFQIKQHFILNHIPWEKSCSLILVTYIFIYITLCSSSDAARSEELAKLGE